MDTIYIMGFFDNLRRKSRKFAGRVARRAIHLGKRAVSNAIHIGKRVAHE